MIDLPLRIAELWSGWQWCSLSCTPRCRSRSSTGKKGDWLACRVGWLVPTTLARPALRRRSYDQIQDVLAWVMPLYILLLIVVWFALVQVGFSLLIWSSQAEHSVLQAVIASGSALRTLGFLTLPGIAGQLLAIPEGAMGLGIVVFYD